jgi:hypothetical protein
MMQLRNTAGKIRMLYHTFFSYAIYKKVRPAVVVMRKNGYGLNGALLMRRVVLPMEICHLEGVFSSPFIYIVPVLACRSDPDLFGRIRIRTSGTGSGSWP